MAAAIRSNSTGSKTSSQLVVFSKQCWPRKEVVYIDDVTAEGSTKSKGDDTLWASRTQLDFAGKTIGLYSQFQYCLVNYCSTVLKNVVFSSGIVSAPSSGFTILSPLELERPVSASKLVADS